MTNYATIQDIRAAGYPLSEAQETAATTLLGQACARLRLTARKYGRDIDELIEDPATGEDYALAVKSVVVQSVCRALDAASHTGSAAVTQGSESLGAYSVSMTYLNAGQSLYFQRSELKDLGLVRQRFGCLNIYAEE